MGDGLAARRNGSQERLSGSLEELIEEKTSDGTLTDDDMRSIIDSVRFETDQTVTSEKMDLVVGAAEERLKAANEGKRVPVLLRVLGALIVAAGLAYISTLVFAIIRIVQGAETIEAGNTSDTLFIIEGIRAALALAAIVVGIVFGYRLLRDRRRNAARTLLVLIVLSALVVVCTIMVYGVGVELIQPGITLIVEAVLLVYLDPTLIQERRLRQKLRVLDNEVRAEQGTLGRDLTGRGYIKLDFFNLFWIFMLGCVLGDLGETIYHMAVVDPGVFQNRTGMLFGPFSPIYGFGGVLMTIVLNRFHNKNFLIIFLVSALLGGAFEFFVSWFLDTSFGIVAWDYSGTFLSIGGRTNGFFMCIWGIAGTIWIKGLLPIVLKGINLIPWKLRYSVTSVCMTLMIINGIMTLQAVDCWYERLSGHTPDTQLEQFYAEHFDDDWMANHFQSMSVTPGGGHEVS